MAIKNPLTYDEIVELHKNSEEGFIQVDVLVDFNVTLEMNFEEFLDFLCDLVGSPLLQDIGYQVTGFAGDDTLIITVTADATYVVEQGA